MTSSSPAKRQSDIPKSRQDSSSACGAAEKAPVNDPAKTSAMTWCFPAELREAISRSTNKIVSGGPKLPQESNIKKTLVKAFDEFKHSLLSRSDLSASSRDTLAGLILCPELDFQKHRVGPLSCRLHFGMGLTSKGSRDGLRMEGPRTSVLVFGDGPTATEDDVHEFDRSLSGCDQERLTAGVKEVIGLYLKQSVRSLSEIERSRREYQKSRFKRAKLRRAKLRHRKTDNTTQQVTANTDTGVAGKECTEPHSKTDNIIAQGTANTEEEVGRDSRTDNVTPQGTPSTDNEVGRDNHAEHSKPAEGKSREKSLAETYSYMLGRGDSKNPLEGVASHLESWFEGHRGRDESLDEGISSDQHPKEVQGEPRMPDDPVSLLFHDFEEANPTINTEPIRSALDSGNYELVPKRVDNSEEGQGKWKKREYVFGIQTKDPNPSIASRVNRIKDPCNWGEQGESLAKLHEGSHGVPWFGPVRLEVEKSTTDARDEGKSESETRFNMILSTMGDYDPPQGWTLGGLSRLVGGSWEKARSSVMGM